LNPKQEKRFWSADQKRFVYSLKSAAKTALFSMELSVSMSNTFC